MKAERLPKERRERRKLPASVRFAVLMEASYKCARPSCRNIITLQLHHIYPVGEGGKDELSNLIALCGYCHGMHHSGHFPIEAIRHWKGMLVALNHAFDPAGMDLLLFLKKVEGQLTFTSDGVVSFARLIAADLVVLKTPVERDMGNTLAELTLSDRGHLIVDAWIEGDEEKYIASLRPLNASV